MNFGPPSTSSIRRSFGVGKSTLNVSMCASSPNSLNFARSHSALSLSYGEPTLCGRAVSRCMYSRSFAGSGVARNFSSHPRSTRDDWAENPAITGSSAAIWLPSGDKAATNKSAEARPTRRSMYTPRICVGILPEPTRDWKLRDAIGLIMFGADHHQALRRHRGAGFRAIAQFEQPVDVVGPQFPLPDVQQRADHFSNHIAQKGSPVHSEDEFLIVGSRAYQLRRENLALHLAFLVVFVGSCRSRKRSEVMDADKLCRRHSHRILIKWPWIMQHVPPNHRRQ